MIDYRTYCYTDSLYVGYEEKDLGADGAPFYLASGVHDVLIVDPRAGLVYYDTVGRARQTLAVPATIDLDCGCCVSVT